LTAGRRCGTIVIRVIYATFVSVSVASVSASEPAVLVYAIMTTPSASQSASDSLTSVREHLRRELRGLAVGESLPPLRELQRRVGTGRMRLERVLREFEQRGDIERRARSGIYKTEPTAPVTPAHSMIELIVCDASSDAHHGPWFSAAVVSALAEQAGGQGLGLRFRQFPRMSPLADYQRLAERTDLKAAVLHGPHMPDLAGLFEERGIATVSIYPRVIQRHGTTIQCHEDHLVRDQLEHLFALGHRRIGYFDLHGPEHEEGMIPFLFRRDAYHRRMAERGIRVAPHWVQPADGDPQNIHRALSAMFDADPAPSAVVVTDSQLPSVYRFFERRGLRIGHDVSVMGTDDLSEAMQVHPHATTVRNPRREIAARAFDLLRQRLADEPAPARLRIKPELIVRDSTGPARTHELPDTSPSRTSFERSR